MDIMNKWVLSHEEGTEFRFRLLEEKYPKLSHVELWREVEKLSLLSLDINWSSKARWASCYPGRAKEPVPGSNEFLVVFRLSMWLETDPPRQRSHSSIRNGDRAGDLHKGEEGMFACVWVKRHWKSFKIKGFWVLYTHFLPLRKDRPKVHPALQTS